MESRRRAGCGTHPCCSPPVGPKAEENAPQTKAWGVDIGTWHEATETARKLDSFVKKQTIQQLPTNWSIAMKNIESN